MLKQLEEQRHAQSGYGSDESQAEEWTLVLKKNRPSRMSLRTLKDVQDLDHELISRLELHIVCHADGDRCSSCLAPSVAAKTSLMCRDASSQGVLF